MQKTSANVRINVSLVEGLYTSQCFDIKQSGMQQVETGYIVRCTVVWGVFSVSLCYDGCE